MNKKHIAIITVLIILIVALSACTKKVDKSSAGDKETVNTGSSATTDEISGSIVAADSADTEISVDEVDSSVEGIKSDLDNW